MRVIYSALLLLLIVGKVLQLSYAHATWPNEPPGSETLLDCTFDTLDCGGQLFNVYKSGDIVEDSDAPGSAPRVGRASLFYPQTQGGIVLVYTRRAPLRELYVGFWLKVNKEWQQNSVGTNKVFFVRTDSALEGGTRTNGYWGVHGYGNPMQLIWSHNTGTQDNSHACASELGLECYPNVGSGNIFFGRWHRIEAYVRASDCETCRNAIVRWWVDGELTGNYTNLNYGTKVVNEWVWAQTWDGQGNALGRSRDVHEYIDDLHISAPKCSMPCAVTSNIAPAPPPKDGRPGAPADVHVTVNP